MVTLILPRLLVPDAVTSTPAGRLVVPGFSLPEREVTIDPDQIRTLIEEARRAAGNAYAPFSKFHVGAAVIMASDPVQRIFTGANVENSSYGGTLCAERTALSAAVTSRPENEDKRLRYLAVSVRDALGDVLPNRSPCGLCRQFIRQFCDPAPGQPPPLIFVDDGAPDTLGQVFDIERLLPWGFRFEPRT